MAGGHWQSLWLVNSLFDWWTVFLAGRQVPSLVDRLFILWTVVMAGGKSHWLVDSLFGWWTVFMAGGQSSWLVDNFHGWWTVSMAGGEYSWLVDSLFAIFIPVNILFGAGILLLFIHINVHPYSCSSISLFIHIPALLLFQFFSSSSPYCQFISIRNLSWLKLGKSNHGSFYI